MSGSISNTKYKYTLKPEHCLSRIQAYSAIFTKNESVCRVLDPVDLQLMDFSQRQGLKLGRETKLGSKFGGVSGWVGVEGYTVQGKDLKSFIYKCSLITAV